MVHAIPEESDLQPLSPREIQARVRAGATPEDVAAETGWPLDKVNRYAEPPLGEREYVATQARGVEISRSRGGSTLEDSVCQRLNVGAERIAWDSFRTDDARWIVTAALEGRQVGTWAYDPVGRSVHPQDESARALMGGGPSTVSEAPTEAESAESESTGSESTAPEADGTPLQDQPRPRLVSVTSDPVAPATVAPPVESAAPVEDRDRTLASEPTSGDQAQLLEASDLSSAPRRAKRTKGKKGRASVPSWDEILFGASRPED